MHLIDNGKLKRTPKKVIKILIINLIIFLLIVVAVEMVIRIIFPNINVLGNSKNLFQYNKYGSSFGLTPNNHGYSYGAEVITDARGFRIDPSSQMSSGKYVILVLGDSVSFGLGVAARDSFPLMLQKHVKDCQIINGSVIGYSSEDYYNVLSHWINSGLKFEGVIVSICLNDFSTESQANIEKQFQLGYYKRYPNRV
ncbi:MAG: hypothetical protein WBV23_07435, partial [Desulfobaccales bacterium]